MLLFRKSSLWGFNNLDMSLIETCFCWQLYGNLIQVFLVTTQPHLYLINLQFSSDLSFLLAGTPCLSRWPGATLCSFYNLLGLWIFDQEGTFFSFHTHSVHRWGRFWPLLAPLAKSHKEFAGTTADQLLIFVLKIAPRKTDQAWVAIRKVFLNHLSRRTEFKGLFFSSCQYVCINLNLNVCQ